MSSREDERRPEVDAILRTLGVGLMGARDPARDLNDFALDQTITPGTFARRSAAPKGEPETAAQEEGAPKVTLQGSASAAISASIGPLPRIALSGAAVRAAERAESEGGAPADFEVLRILGEGGMGRVHLARQRSLGRDVAIKSLKEEVADTRVSEMLRAEATVMGRLEHPNVVPVHAVGLDEHGRLVLVMKRIDGVAWSELLKNAEHPRWTGILASATSQLEFHLDVLVAIARALHFAHQEGVIHRDVKPDNVLVGAHGDVYLADWGIALRLGGDDAEPQLVGTPAYMAPEMVAADPSKIDARTDVFLLGATLHEVLTGKPPHQGKNLHQVLIAAFDAEPSEYAPEVPPELAAIARTAMAKDPSARYPSALAFQRAIDDVRRHRGSIALARSGLAILSEIEHAAANDPALDRKLTEARFAFVQALRDWPDNHEAETALETCLRRALAHELSRENAVGARALLAELSKPEAGLLASIEALEEKLRARIAESERLKKLEAEQDLTVGHRARTTMMVGLITVTTLISIVIGFQTEGDAGALSGRELIGISALILLVAAVPIVALRKRLLANAVGRRIAGLVVLSCAALLVHRILGVAWGVAPEAILVMDMAIFAGIAAAAGTVSSRLLWAIPVPLLGAAVATLLPDRVTTVFSITGLLTLLSLALLLLSSYRAPKG